MFCRHCATHVEGEHNSDVLSMRLFTGCACNNTTTEPTNLLSTHHKIPYFPPFRVPYSHHPHKLLVILLVLYTAFPFDSATFPLCSFLTTKTYSSITINRSFPSPPLGLATFHTSNTSVSPGYTTLANRAWNSRRVLPLGPTRRVRAHAMVFQEQRPWRIGRG